MQGFLCSDPFFSSPPPLSPSIPEAPSLILPSVRFQSNDEAACVWKYWIAKTSLGERVCEWSFQRQARPGPCATDWWTTNGILCPEKERKGGETGDREKQRDTEKVVVVVFFWGGSSIWGPVCRSEMPYHMTCLTFGPHSVKAVRLLSNREHKASQPQRPPFTPTPPCSSTPKVIGKSNVTDLHFPSLYRRAKLLRFPDNVKGRESDHFGFLSTST